MSGRLWAVQQPPPRPLRSRRSRGGGLQTLSSSPALSRESDGRLRHRGARLRRPSTRGGRPSRRLGASWASALGARGGSRARGPPAGDATTCCCFALLHDAAREHDGHDSNDGERAAALARRLHGGAFTLDADRLAVLAEEYASRVRHSHPSPDDRGSPGRRPIDFGRVGITPSPEMLSTDASRALAADGIEPADTSPPDVLEAYRIEAAAANFAEGGRPRDRRDRPARRTQYRRTCPYCTDVASVY